MPEVIREALKRFLNRREHAFKAALASGKQVNDYGRKMAAIKALRIQLQASSGWSNVRWIWTMREEIIVLLPHKLNPDPAQVKCRKQILTMIQWCSGHQQEPQLNILQVS